MATELGVSSAVVSRHWRANRLKPISCAASRFSRDPNFVETWRHRGAVLSPPEHALVLCCDEKSQVQALDRTQPGLPLKRRARPKGHSPTAA